MRPRFAPTLLSLAAAFILGSCTAPTMPDSAAAPPTDEAAAQAEGESPTLTPIAFSGCVSPREREAFEVYALRIEALVGAQSCRMTDRFNTFAIKFRGELTTQGRAMRAYYQKSYGTGGDAALDTFVTDLSNTTFVYGSTTSDFCTATKSLLDSLMAARVGQLAAFSAQRPAHALPAMDSCGGAPPKS